jgi:molybdopterin-guanine dinucleotide biosynthesis protein A
MMRSQDIAVVVLAGGEGRRMGGAKPLRRFGGATLIGRALELAHGYGGPVAVAVRDPAQVTGAGDAPLLIDHAAIGGPIAGLASALAFARGNGARAVLTLPCDTPWLPPDLRARLDAALEPGVGAAVAASVGRLHPTCALWRASAGPRLGPYLASGRSSLIGFAEACGMARVDWPQGGLDPFANANTRDDLVRLQPQSSPSAEPPVRV